MEPAKLKVTELRDELAARGLSTKGLKAELVARLDEYIEAHGDAIPEVTAAVEDITTKVEPEKPVSPRKTRSSPKKLAKGFEEAQEAVQEKPFIEPEAVQEEEAHKAPTSPSKGKRGRPAKSEESESDTKKPATASENEVLTAADIEEVHAAKLISVPKNEPSTVLHISNLHRPFTERQLKEFVGSGYVTFWLEDVKSQALVQFGSVEEAERRRQRLAGLVFPPESGHVIEADFGTESRLDELLQPVDDVQVSNSSNTLASLFKKTTVEPAIYYLLKN